MDSILIIKGSFGRVSWKIPPDLLEILQEREEDGSEIPTATQLTDLIRTFFSSLSSNLKAASDSSTFSLSLLREEAELVARLQQASLISKDG